MLIECVNPPIPTNNYPMRRII